MPTSPSNTNGRFQSPTGEIVPAQRPKHKDFHSPLLEKATHSPVNAIHYVDKFFTTDGSGDGFDDADDEPTFPEQAVRGKTYRSPATG